MSAVVAGLASGLLFGVGLVLSGMTQPVKVIGFLDVAGDWDPSLALVMGGAIAVYAPAYRWITRTRQPAFAGEFVLPTQTRLDPSLLVGAAIFGGGWGLAGYCPGPGIVAAGTGQLPPIVFVVSMLAGMFLHQALVRSPAPPAGPTLEPQTEPPTVGS